MQKQEFSKLRTRALQWMAVYDSLSKDMVDFSYVETGRDDEVLLVDLLEHTAANMNPVLVGLEDDFNGETGMLVDPSGWASASFISAKKRWWKAVRSTWDALVLEIEPKLWILIPRGMANEQREG